MATVLSIVALVISLIGLAFAIWSWRESNRPVVVGYIETVQARNVATVNQLVVENVGFPRNMSGRTRPRHEIAARRTERRTRLRGSPYRLQPPT